MLFWIYRNTVTSKVSNLKCLLEAFIQKNLLLHHTVGHITNRELFVFVN